MRSQLAGIADEKTRRILITVFEYVLGNITLGAPEHQERAKNLQAYWLTGTSSTTANQEFSIAHGLNTAPKYAIPAVDLGSSNTKTIRLQTTRPADSKRVYFASPETSANITLLVEP